MVFTNTEVYTREVAFTCGDGYFAHITFDHVRLLVKRCRSIQKSIYSINKPRMSASMV